MTARTALRQEIFEIEREQESCIVNGSVIDCKRYRYQVLERDRIGLQQSLDWLEGADKKRPIKKEPTKRKAWWHIWQ